MSTVDDYNTTIIEEFRTNSGRVASFGDTPLLLLHTTGARSGAERVNPVVYLEIDRRRYVFASKAGADTNPDWYHNLVAHPSVSVEAGTETYPATAVPVAGEERDRIFAEQKRRNTAFAEYETKTSRVIPVVELRRI